MTSPAAGASPDLTRLSGPPPDDGEEAASLALAGLRSGSAWWTGLAVGWVEGGVWSHEVHAQLRQVGADSTIAADVRKRAERLARPQALTSTAAAFGPPGPGYRWGHDLFFHRGWRYAAVATPVLSGAAVWVVAADQDRGAGIFFLLGAVGHAVYGLVSYRREVTS